MKYEFDPNDTHDEPVTISGDDDLEFVAPCCEFAKPVTISDCTISELNAYSTSFLSGLCIQNCRIRRMATFQSGGHNKLPILITDTSFESLCDFEDCWFMSDVIIRNVIFAEGTNLTGNKDTPMEVSFDGKLIIENVTGVIDLDTFRR